MNFIYEHAPSASLIFFFGFFLCVAYRAYRPAVKQDMQAFARIPLGERNGHE